MKFDYVVVGGGSAGCVMASRLSEDPNVSVCLIEAGGNGRDIFVRAPALVAGMISGRPKINNWAFHTEPQVGLNGRRGFQPRGRTLGGSSAINAMLYVRGHRKDYDEWADLGAEDGTGREFCPISNCPRATCAALMTCTERTGHCRWPNNPSRAPSHTRLSRLRPSSR